MKRFLVLLLLVLMPLQLVWAASGACCGPDEDKRAQHVCQVSQKQCDDDDGAAGSLLDDGGCDCCHHFCGGALLASAALLPAGERIADAVFDPPHYTSYIPDLIPPPKRPLRA